jgi:hypothetical protein
MELIKLTEEQMIRAFTAGIKRQSRHRDPITGERGSTHRFVPHDPAFIGDIYGCLIEMAVSVYFGTTWNSEDWDLKEHSQHKSTSDVEPHFEVRRARSIKGELTIRNTDADHKVAVLGTLGTEIVSGKEFPRENLVILLGAITVEEARQKFKPSENGNVYVPVSALYPVKDFVLTNA